MLAMNILWDYALSLTHIRSHINNTHTPHLTVGAGKCWDMVQIKYRKQKPHVVRKLI